MKTFYLFACFYLTGNIAIVGILGGLIDAALPGRVPLFIKVLLFSGLTLSSLSLIFYLYSAHGLGKEKESK